MKHTFLSFIIALIAVISLTSCNGAKKCWSIHSTLSGVSCTKYFWGTEDEAVAEIKRMEKEDSHKDVTKFDEVSYKTSQDCLANNF